MITPAYSLTATERVRPRLALDFTTAVADPRVGTARAANTATRFNQNGLIEIVNANLPRFDFSPTALTCQGQLIEETRANLFLNSLIDGTNLSTQSVTLSAVAYTLSFYGSGSVAISGGHSATVSGVGDFPNRKNYTFTPTAGSSTFTVSGDVKFAQLEAGAFPTSYIPTTTTSLTRNADVVSMTGTNFSGWWRPSRGTMVVRGRQMVTTGTRPWVYISDGTADNAISLRGNGVNPELFVKATTDQVQIDMGTLAANVSQRLAGAWATNDCAASLDGGIPVVDTSAAIPTVDRMLIGSDGTNYLNGWIERIEFFDERLIAPELQVAASQFGYRSIVGPVIYSTTIR